MSQSADKCIQVKNLIAGFQDSKPVCRIDELCLERASIAVLCGPNGAGKSTLLKTIAKQIPTLSGSVKIDGVGTTEMPRVEISRRLAYVPQLAETRRSLTVEEWVALGRNPHQQWWSWVSSAKDRQTIEAALRRTDCYGLKDKTIETLSGGERQRVLIATALAQEPSYMLLDEPTAHLDFRHQIELLELLVSLKREGLGLLVVLHDLNLTARIADTIFMLKKVDSGPSIVTATGSVESVLAPEILRQVYGVDMEILSSADGLVKSYIARSIHLEP